MKRKNAKEILAESFRELAKTTNVEKITIKDIVDNCGYSPATFYRYFTDKYDLIAWNHAQQMSEIMSHFGEEGYSWKDAYIANISYYQENLEYLRNLLQHTSGHESFVRSMTEIHYMVYEKYLRENHPDQLNEKNKMKIRLFCHGASNLSCEWILGQFKASAEDLASVMEEGFPFTLT